jgi:hypothetical protein
MQRSQRRAGRLRPRRNRRTSLPPHRPVQVLERAQDWSLRLRGLPACLSRRAGLPPDWQSRHADGVRRRRNCPADGIVCRRRLGECRLPRGQACLAGRLERQRVRRTLAGVRRSASRERRRFSSRERRRFASRQRRRSALREDSRRVHVRSLINPCIDPHQPPPSAYHCGVSCPAQYVVLPAPRARGLIPITKRLRRLPSPNPSRLNLPALCAGLAATAGGCATPAAVADAELTPLPEREDQVTRLPGSRARRGATCLSRRAHRWRATRAHELIRQHRQPPRRSRLRARRLTERIGRGVRSQASPRTMRNHSTTQGAVEQRMKRCGCS